MTEKELQKWNYVNGKLKEQTLMISAVKKIDEELRRKLKIKYGWSLLVGCLLCFVAGVCVNWIAQ